MSAATRYEIVLTLPDTSRYVVGYSAQVSRSGLLKAMRGAGNILVDALKLTDEDPVSFGCQPRPFASFGHNGERGHVEFTGRTLRSITTEGSALESLR